MLSGNWSHLFYLPTERLIDEDQSGPSRKRSCWTLLDQCTGHYAETLLALETHVHVLLHLLRSLNTSAFQFQEQSVDTKRILISGCFQFSPFTYMSVWLVSESDVTPHPSCKVKPWVRNGIVCPGASVSGCSFLSERMWTEEYVPLPLPGDAAGV